MSKREKHLSIRTGGNSAGRVEVDSRGNNVWRWEGDSGEGTSTLRRKLDNEELELEPTRAVRAAGKAPPPASSQRPDPAEGTPTVLKRLAETDLDLEPTRATRARGERSGGGSTGPAPGSGFDPYNSG